MPKGKRKLVKCIVCGEIFDSEIDTCPVCGVGREYFIPYDGEEVLFRKDTQETFIILGNGAAGISAAEAIRERNDTGRIIIISKEAELSYNRPLLTKKLTTFNSSEEILMHQPDWYEENQITNYLGREIKKIDTGNKTVILNNDEEIKFDKCIYALGAESFVPAIKGSGLNGVKVIRNLQDVSDIRELSKNAKQAVVIGGGVLGLETAWELSKLCKVTILEAADRLMVRQLDDTASEMLGNLITKVGIDYRVGAAIAEITGNEKVTGVALNTGEVFEADLVIFSCGITPNTVLAKEAGLQVGKAVEVNDKMETNIDSIYACGDCAECKGVNYGVWAQAIEMGKTAGANAAGEDTDYDIYPPALTFHGMKTALFAGGDNGKLPDKEYQTLEYRNDLDGNYEKFYFLENKLVGAILLGDTRKMNKVSEGLNVGCSYNYVKNNIIHD